MNRQKYADNLIPASTAESKESVYQYFPGCSLHSTGLEYHRSVEAVFHHLGTELLELDGWNCCGASSAHSMNPPVSMTLPARNLVLAGRLSVDLAVPCAACFSRMKTVQYLSKSNPETKAWLTSEVGSSRLEEVRVRHILEILHEDFGCQAISGQVRRSLNGMKVAAYYGCLLVRPPEITRFDNPDNPYLMPDLLSAVGADVVRWSESTECCGGSLSLARADIVYRLVDRLVSRAREAGAEALVTACPLCQVNLEMRQNNQNHGMSSKMPVFYFTELLGLAFGIKEAEKWWAMHLIDPRPLLSSYQLLTSGANYAVRSDNK